jgi:hypothetical protein
MTKQNEKKQRLRSFKQDEAVVRSILNEWAPLGTGLPEDEYDCLAHRILDGLYQANNSGQLQVTIQGELVDHLGLKGFPAKDIGQVTATIWSWWLRKNQKEDTLNS